MTFTFNPSANALQDAEEVVQDEVEDGEKDAGQKTITFEEIMNEVGNESADDNITRDQEDEENNYHEEFVNEIKRKAQLEQIKEGTNEVNFDEDDDKFIIGL